MRATQIHSWAPRQPIYVLQVVLRCACLQRSLCALRMLWVHPPLSSSRHVLQRLLPRSLHSSSSLHSGSSLRSRKTSLTALKI